MNITGKKVVVTAGAAGIGAAIASRFNKAGASVLVCDKDPVAVSKFTDSSIKAFTADVSDETSVRFFFKKAREVLGGFDILVNNAGIAGPTKSVENITLEEWEETFKVNITGHFLCIREVVPVFKAQKSGVIINISSVAGRVGMPFRSPYSASKFSVRGLTEVLAIELGEFNIRVNSIMPGLVNGPRIREVVQQLSNEKRIAPEQYLRGMLHNVSMHAMVEPTEVADTALFLASDAARHISGQSISVCGNFESYRQPLML